MLKKSYDIVIWGDSLCAILTAAGLSDKGLDVLFLLDSADTEKALPFSDESSPLPVGGIPETELTKNLLGKVGVDFYDRNFFTQCEPLLQIIIGKERMDITDSIEGNAKELCRGTSKESRKIAEIFIDGVKIREKSLEFLRGGINIFPPHNLSKKISYFLRRRGRKTPIPKEPFCLASSGLKCCDLLEKAASLLARASLSARPDNYAEHLLSLPLCGRPSFSPLKGMKALKKLLLEQLRNKGVDIVETSGITGLEFVKNRVDAIRFNEKVLPAKAFLFGGLSEGLIPLLPDSFPGRAMKKSLSSHRPSGLWQSIFISVEEDVMPFGMQNELLVDTTGNGDPLLIQRIYFSGGTEVSDGQRLLKFSRPMTFIDRVEGADPLNKTVSNVGGLSGDFEGLVIEELKRLIPFVDGRFKVLHRSDNSKPDSADDYIYSGDYKRPFNIGSMSPRTNFPNLFMANKELIPILGIEGDFVAADVLAGYLVDAVSLPGD